MNVRSKILSASEGEIGSGRFLSALQRAVSYQTVSGSDGDRIQLKSYLDDFLSPMLRELGCAVERFDSWNGGKNSFLIGSRIENPDVPTVLCYGHADVTPGQEGEWHNDRDPWRVTVEGIRWYGRGTADNKGQHLINLTALHLVLAEKSSLGFNLKFLFEAGEEIGSPLLAEFVTQHQTELAADVFIASDGPRVDAETPTIFLGSRGSVELELTAHLRPDSYHSGNWGGLIRNPATTLAAAIGTLVDGNGNIRIETLLPDTIPGSVSRRLEKIRIPEHPHEGESYDGWGAQYLTAAERLYAWNTLEILAMSSGNISDPTNSIPGSASALLQLRFVSGTDVLDLESRVQEHLDARGFGMVRVRVSPAFPASRTDPDNPWVDWVARSIFQTTGVEPSVLPNFGGALPNHVFEGILGLPTLWVPHSYPECLQHAPNEHLLEPLVRQGLAIACGIFYDLGNGGHPARRDHPAKPEKHRRSPEIHLTQAH
ncbi:M20 family metallopeptidase [Lysinibacter sp. HNR]|uniref:M20 family metallopeptidase n=1 Tax=Lysinibacter sp. HNR TaxID=3031408 RepID=UPI0024355372|nr:M20 family metallopeptidase [Lysinibacter sp. HNR]WGD38293.1 M20 family metallopeptidase [Lysinibacter sp. HNR]